MNLYLRWFILSLPLWMLLCLWQWLPARIVIHLANGDRWLARDDFGGVVVGATAGVALFAYGLLQIQLLAKPLSPRALNQAYFMIAGGSASIGLLLVGIGLLSPQN